VVITQLCCNYGKVPQFTNKQTWLCFNETLQKTGSEVDLSLGL
jgi:hypothetical protein